jgi:hypothetical protein
LPGALFKYQGLVALEPFDDVVQLGLELFQALEGRQLVIRQGAQGAVFEDGLGDLFFGLVQGSGDLVGVAVAGGQAF